MDPWTIVVALACVVLGAPDVPRLLLEFAGKSPVVDIAICAFVMAMVTAHLLGVALLARFIRKAPRRLRAPATDLFGKMTLVVCMGVAFLAAACLVVVPGGGLTSSTRLVFDFAGKSPVAAVAGSLPFIMPLIHVLRQARNAAGGAAATRATDHLAGMTRPAACLATVLSLVVGTGLLVSNSLVKPAAGLDALPLFRCFTNTFFGIGAATVVGAVLLAHFSRCAARSLRQPRVRSASASRGRTRSM